MNSTILAADIPDFPDVEIDNAFVDFVINVMTGPIGQLIFGAIAAVMVVAAVLAFGTVILSFRSKKREDVTANIMGNGKRFMLSLAGVLLAFSAFTILSVSFGLGESLMQPVLDALTSAF